MVKLNRFTMPVFAGNAAQTQTSVFGTMKTSPQYTTDVAASIGTTAYGNGWADAIEIGYAPYMEDMNTLQRAITYQILYNQQQGIPEWDSSTEYYIGSLAKLNTANGSQVYSSLIDNNVGNLVSDATKWKLLFDTENSYVTTNTAQTITGAKTFTTNVTKKSSIPYTSAPSETVWDSMDFKDSNGNFGGRLVHVTSTDGSQSMGLFITNPIYNGTTVLDWESVGIRRTSTGNTYGYCPTSTQTTSTSSDEMTNVGWVNTTGNNVVHLTDTETISGAKIFTNVIYSTRTDADDICFSIKDTNVSVSSNPSTQGTRRIRFTDKDNNRLTEVQSSKNTSGKTTLGLLASNTVSGADVNAIMSIHVEADGTKYATCPASDVNGSIVTTVAKSKSGNGYFQLGNGLIIQWGTISTTTDNKTITLPKAFTTTNYTVCVTQEYAVSSENNIAINSQTTTSFNIYALAGERVQVIRWMAIGY